MKAVAAGPNLGVELQNRWKKCLLHKITTSLVFYEPVKSFNSIGFKKTAKLELNEMGTSLFG